MKNYLKDLWIIIVMALLVPSVSIGGSEVTPGKGMILKSLTDLEKAESRIMVLRAEIKKTQRILDNNILGVIERGSLEGLVANDRQQISAYRTDERMDWRDLRDHWKLLKPEERNRAEEAQIGMS